MAKVKSVMRKYWTAWILTVCCIILVFIIRSAQGALAVGTNCGFVTEAPVADPGGIGVIGLDTYSVACDFTSPADATKITELGWWCDNATEAADYDIGIYTDNAGVPNAVVHIAADNAKGTTAGWKKVTGLNIAISGSTKYHLAVQVDNTATTTNCDYAIEAGYNRNYKTPQTALPDPWGSSSTTADRILAIYAVWEAAEEEVGGQVIVIQMTAIPLAAILPITLALVFSRIRKKID